MKIGILTHYNVNNQGAQLQMYGLYHQLKELGHNPVILTYTKNFDLNKEQRIRTQISPRSIPYILKNYLLKKGIRLTWHNTIKYNKNTKFRKEIFAHENYATSDVDAVVIGSDQVFGVEYGINIPMFGFGMLTNKVFAYAPSFAQTTIEDLKKHNYLHLVSAGLKHFASLSVRDRHSSALIKELIGMNPPIVCDPALLYDFSKVKTNVSIPREKYLLVYSYDRRMVDPIEVRALKNYAKGKGLITVSPGTFHKWCDKNITCNCLEWIEYFRNATLVVTDTYHGTIASLIGQVPFATCIRETNSNKMTDLLRVTDCAVRRISEVSEQELHRVLDQPMDYKKVNENIKDLRKESLSYLKQALEMCS